MEYKKLSLKFIVGLILILYVVMVNATTIESQTISEDTTWDNIDEPYEINGTVTVAPEVTLNISAGAELKFASGVSLTVNGTLITKGVTETPIVFAATDNGSQWSGIKFNSGSVGSVIQHAHISGATNCIEMQGSVHVINRNIIRGCNTGIYIHSGAPSIENNLIVENGTQGIYVTNSSTPRIRYNTLDLNGTYGVYFYLPSTQVIFENNIVSRNQTGLYRSHNSTLYDFTLAYNNVWGNGADYTNMAADETDLSSDPEFLSPYLGDRRLDDNSPSKTASSEDNELGAYGNGGNLAVYTDVYQYSTTPTTEGSLTQNERWSGEVTLTGSVTVARPYQLQIEPGTVIKMPAGAAINVDSSVSIVGTLADPIIFAAADNGSQWSG
ncbi:MAG: right-handed parallel beta-helix repeat-containing protein, partial [Methyloprofundus sp.]|nr:right-handed parallel beta-helix repeat-containing protein [Methyloprofundus sp.]